MRTTLYFIVTEDETAVMFGLTKFPDRILANTQDCSPVKLRLYGNLEYINRADAVMTKETLKADFDSRHMHSDWYELSMGIRGAIDDLVQKGVPGGSKVAMVALRASEEQEWHQYGQEDQKTGKEVTFAKTRAKHMGIPRKGNRWIRLKHNWIHGWEMSEALFGNPFEIIRK